MKMLKLGLCVVLSLAAATSAQTLAPGTPACESWIFSHCLNKTETNFQAQIDVLDFDAACTAFKKVDACYSLARIQSSCATFSDVIDGLQNKVRGELATYCPSGKPDHCLNDLAECLEDYSAITDPHDKNLCAAASKAANCTEQLSCPPALQVVIATKRRTIEQDLASSGCIETDDKSSPCLQDAAKCLNPLEQQLLDLEKSYDFAGLCGVWPEIKTCFDKLNADQRCTEAKPRLDAKWTDLTAKYHQYCSLDDKPLACLGDLQLCTDEYKNISALPQFTQDPLYLCQGLERLIACMGQVKADLKTCPSVVGVKAIASYQKEQAQADKTCSKILTVCTTKPSRCVLKADLGVAQALEFTQFDKVCQLTHDLEACLATKDPQCTNNPFLLAETNYVKNVSGTFCQAGSNDAKSKACLAAIEKCEQNWMKDFLGGQICSAQTSLVSCLDRISCKDAAVQKQLAAVRAKATSDECDTGSAVGLKAAVVSLCLPFTLLMRLAL